MDDRISSLPDEILCYILSFLPTNQVVVSSVLSKRWKFLWRSVRSLDFYCGDIEFQNHFLRSVDSFLYCRDRDQPLHKFRLELHFRHFVVDINRWMMAAVSGSGRLQHLDLNLNHNCPIPSFVFCKTLVVLKLTDVLLQDNFFVDLPLLKILHLNDVMLPKDLDLSHVLCGCPNLEDLELNDMDCEIKGKVNRFPKLVRASINNGILPLEIFKDVHVLKFHLVMPMRFVCYFFYFPFGREKMWDFCCFDVISRFLQKYQPTLDLDFYFQNLVQLEMVFQLTKYWPRVFEVLKHSPKLQTLVIDKSLFDFVFEEEKYWSVPACISSQLKSCCIKDYKGCIDEILFAEYIIENAMYLRTMKICCVWCATHEHGLDMFEDLSLLHRSDTCKISLGSGAGSKENFFFSFP